MYKFELVRNYDEVNGLRLSAKLIPENENEIERFILEKSIKKLEEELGMRERILKATILGKIKILEEEKEKVNKELDYMEKIKDILDFVESEENEKYYKFDLNFSKVIENLDFQGAEYTFNEIRREMELLREINVDSAIRKVNKSKEEKEDNKEKLNRYEKAKKMREEDRKENYKYYITLYYKEGKEKVKCNVYFKNRFIYKCVCNNIEGAELFNKNLGLIKYILDYSCNYDKKFIDYVLKNDIKIYIDKKTVRYIGLGE